MARREEIRPEQSIHMDADAKDRAVVYQAGQSITIQYHGGEAEPRQAAVVAQLSADVEGDAAAFIGRHQPAAAVLARLEPVQPPSAGTAISVISGLAGVGKTALARHVASMALCRGWFAAAVLADLRGYDPDPQARVVPGQLFSSILRALGASPIEIPASGSEQAAAYHQVLTSMARDNQRVLLVFDNVSSPVQISGLIPEAALHRVLITSRDTLGELDNIGLVELDTLPEDEAVAVLSEVMRQRRPADPRIAQCREDAGELARLCGCLPLALRIVGGLLAEDPALSLAELTGDLADTTTRLEGLVYGERAVSAAFDLSWQELVKRDQAAAQLFLELPINPSPEISSEAASALFGRPGPQTRRLLRILRRGHFIEFGNNTGHWRMHDLLRLYADGIRRLEAARDYAPEVKRLLRYYLTCTEAARNQLLGRPQRGAGLFTSRDEALDWLDAERPNLTGAVLLAAEVGCHELAVDLSVALSTFLRIRNHSDDYIVTATTGAQEAGLLRDSRREAMIISNLGLAPQESRLIDDVLASHQRKCLMYRASGDHESEAWALTNLGSALAARQRFDDVIDIAQQTKRLFHNLGDGTHEAWSLTMLGLALQKTGRTNEAISAHQAARAIFQQQADQDGEAWALTNLGASLRAAKRFTEAIEVGRQASEIFEEVADCTGEGATLVNQGEALRGLGRLDEAVLSLEQACRTFQEAGDLQREGTARNDLGVTLRALGRLDNGIGAHKQALTTFQEVGDRYGEASSLAYLGTALSQAHMIPEARRHWESAVDIFLEIGADHDAEWVRSMIAEVDDRTPQTARR